MATPGLRDSIGCQIEKSTTEPQPSTSTSAENLPDFKRENLLNAPGSFLEDPSSKDLELFDELGDVISAQQARENDSEEREKATDPNLVEWDGPDDPENPMNFKPSRKWIITIATSLITFVATFSSSVFSTATVATSEEYHVSTEVTTLGTSLCVAGFATGPLVWGPASELFGRKVPMFIGLTVFCIFQIPVAVAQNIQTIMICRYLGGFFGVAPLAIVGGTLADFWGPIDRSVAITVFAGATFVGPVAGPVMGSFITESYLGWRWTAWITLIMGAASGLIGVITIPETYHPRLLQLRAAKMRYETKNWAFHSRADENKKDLKTMVQTYLFRPIQMLVQEPILLMVTIYMALVWGILFLFFEAFPISFDEKRGWSPGLGSLPFLSILIGMLIGCLIVAVSSKTRLARKFKKHGHIIPEERLPPMIFGAVIFPIGLFWFAWTSNPNITWVPQVISGIPIGCGILLIFLQGMNYIVDVYKWYANSAIAANTLLRSGAAAGFPMFAAAMFHNLGVPWATSLLGFLAVALVPVPILFFIYGKRIRQMSRFSPK
ncbi:probable fluconazole resistance protein [Phialocephala subalpina]|uniref:Probable fluconazole resistance protein n=1 Tax=Phialocephala subalpina TaxID=576137 RepID=A0A1L7XR64_9HELO|nr:probable fluconazole resistance protein [Phialocephala subalpina]